MNNIDIIKTVIFNIIPHKKKRKTLNLDICNVYKDSKNCVIPMIKVIGLSFASVNYCNSSPNKKWIFYDKYNNY